MLTPSQLSALKADILADQVLSQIPNTPDGAFAIKDIYNAAASPDYIVWRTSVNEREITGTQSSEGTSWSWTTYKNQQLAEQNAWVRMFNTSLTINPSLPNVRQGIQDIFSGTGAPATQRTHILAICKRKATRVEKLFATGSGTSGSPSTMAFVGSLTFQDVLDARNS